MEKTARESTRAKWRMLHDEFEGLEQTVREFCTERKVNIYTFKDWQKRFRKEEGGEVLAVGGTAGLFRELSPVRVRGSYAITLRGSRVLTVECGFIESELRKLIGILESC